MAVNQMTIEPDMMPYRLRAPNLHSPETGRELIPHNSRSNLLPKFPKAQSYTAQIVGDKILPQLRTG